MMTLARTAFVCLAIGCGSSVAMEDAGPDVPGFTCAGMTDGTQCGDGRICIGGDCVDSVCGDGIIDPRSESCDDRNDITNDCCPTWCTYTCDDDATCDDGNECNGAERCVNVTCPSGGGSSQCQTGVRPDPGTACRFGLGMCREGSCVGLACGDGVLDDEERCDDGNTTSGDGCESDCRFTCERVDPSVLQTWYADCDGDGYAAASAEMREQCTAPAPLASCAGWTLVSPIAGSSDCFDANVLAFPGQTSFSATERGDGSFDYDCDGASSPELTGMLCTIGCAANPDCTVPAEGWVDPCTSFVPPACGVIAQYATACVFDPGAGACVPAVGSDRAQRCR